MTHIFYYSWGGKTKRCAEMTAALLNGALTEIKERTLRKKSIFGFLKSGYEAAKQKPSEIEALPAVSGDRIILAFPIWAGKTPPAINTTLKTLDFTNRQVTVIMTMGGRNTSLPAVDMVRNQIAQRGGLEASFISVVTGGTTEEKWENTLRRELEKQGFSF